MFEFVLDLGKVCDSKIMVKKRKSVLKSSAQVVDSPMKEPRIISKYN